MVWQIDCAVLGSSNERSSGKRLQGRSQFFCSVRCSVGYMGQAGEGVRNRSMEPLTCLERRALGSI